MSVFVPTQENAPIYYISLKPGTLAGDGGAGFYFREKISTNFFPSGLARVDVDFLCTKQFAETFRSTLRVGAPLPQNTLAFGSGISNPLIFPDPSIEEAFAGLTRFKISAYGLAPQRAANSVTYGSRMLVLSKSYQRTEQETQTNEQGESVEVEVTVTTSITEKWMVDTFTSRIAIGSNASSTGISVYQAPMQRKFLKRKIEVTSSGLQSYPPQPTSHPITWSDEIVNVTRRNFGAYDEADVTFEPIPNF